MTEFGEWVVRISWIVNIGVAALIPPMTYFALRERAREIEEARNATPSRSLMRRERPKPKRRAAAEG